MHRRIFMTYDKHRVCALIIAKNEAAGLARIIASAKRYAASVIVVDGHSTDATRQIARAAKVSLIMDHGKGRGDAVRVGIAHAQSEVLVICDADGSTDFQDIPKLVRPILDRESDIVIASRHTGGSFDQPMSFDSLFRSIGSDLAVILVNKRFHSRLTDVHYSFRAINRKIAQSLTLESNDHSIEQEIIISCLKKGYRIKEIPSREFARAWGSPKLKTRMGLSILLHLFRQLYTK